MMLAYSISIYTLGCVLAALLAGIRIYVRSKKHKRFKEQEPGLFELLIPVFCVLLSWFYVLHFFFTPHDKKES